MTRRHPDRGSFDFYQSPATFPQHVQSGFQATGVRMSTARSARQKASVSHLPLWPPHAPAPPALPMPQDPGFDRGRAERCELAQDRQIPPTRCRAAGPTLHPLASETDYERGVLSVSALCISVQQSTPRRGRQMQEVRKILILRPVSSGSKQRRRRDWWWPAPSVCSLGCSSTSKRRRKLLPYRLCIGWLVIAGRFTSRSRLGEVKYS